VRYPFIQTQLQEGRFSLAGLCRTMRVSISGYHAWFRRLSGPESTRTKEERQLLFQIKTVHKESDGTYGSPRIYKDLKAEGGRISRKRIERIMRKHGISARPLKRFKVTTDSNHHLPVAENLLDQNFSVETPNTRWSGDITYIWTGQGWLYLAVILDLWSRRVVGWSMQSHLERALVLEALDAALRKRRPNAADGLICHSDRGSQYASSDYQTILKENGIACSMSRKGNCYDNAPVESFFASLKRELVHRKKFASREDARTAVFAWIEGWYNRRRRHSALGYLSPEEFEQQHQSQPMAA
jgi:transposase InsO family protein